MRAVTLAVAMVLVLGTAGVSQAQEATPPPVPGPERQPVTVCVVENGALREIPIRFVEGDSLIPDGRRFAEAYRVDGRYAASAAWFARNEALNWRDGIYQKYGQPRVLGIGEVVPAGQHQGVIVFVEPGDTRSPKVIYLLVRPGCFFQPYLNQRDSWAER